MIKTKATSWRTLLTSIAFTISGITHGLAPDAQWFTPTHSDTPLTEQRYHYELAKSALKNNELDKFKQYYLTLGDYALVPYLDYALIKRSIYDFKFSDIDRFLETNEGTFLAFRLREQLLQALATKKKWATFLTYYGDDMQHKSLRCHALFARHITKDDTALGEVPNLWVEGRSHPKACDPLFRAWKKSGGLTDDIAWLRFNNAMKNGKRSLSRYVAKLMSPEYKRYANLYLEVHGYPGRIKNYRRFSEQSLKMQQIIAHGVQRFSRIDPVGALNVWERYEAQQLFSKNLSTDTKLYLVKRLTMKGFTEDAEQLISHSQELQQADVVERLIRESLRNQQFAKVLQWISLLDTETQAKDRWQYWLARSLESLPGDAPQAKSQGIYQELAQKRSFYGFLAADKVGSAYNLGHKPSPITPSAELVVENLPAMRRAKELWLKGSHEEARAEWRFATKNMSKSELAAAGKLAQNWGWYNKGIHAMIRGNFWDDLDIRFPLAYKETVEKISNATSVEQTLIYAIARQESAFAVNARSSAGARGLMQLMPGTARQTARKSGLKHRDSYLYDPEYNMQLGTNYLNELLGRFNGNRILAAAAYNAGPHRVNKWIKRTPLELPFDIWIETIPFKETRGYVQNILAFSVIYAHKLGRDTSFITPNELNASANNL